MMQQGYKLNILLLLETLVELELLVVHSALSMN